MIVMYGGRLKTDAYINVSSISINSMILYGGFILGNNTLYVHVSACILVAWKSFRENNSVKKEKVLTAPWRTLLSRHTL